MSPENLRPQKSRHVLFILGPLVFKHEIDVSQILVELIKLASLIITLNKASASAQRISTVLDMPDDVDFKMVYYDSIEDLNTKIARGNYYS